MGKPAIETTKIVAGVELILRREDKPMSRTELVLALKDIGIELKASNPENGLSSFLSRYFRFKHLGKGMWTLRSESKGVE